MLNNIEIKICLTLLSACKRNNLVLILPFIRCNLIFLKSNNFGEINTLYEFEYSLVFMLERDLSNNNSDEHYKQIKYHIIQKLIYTSNSRCLHVNCLLYFD